MGSGLIFLNYIMEKEKIKKLKKYFERQNDVVMAFVFGENGVNSGFWNQKQGAKLKASELSSFRNNLARESQVS